MFTRPKPPDEAQTKISWFDLILAPPRALYLHVIMRLNRSTAPTFSVFSTIWSMQLRAACATDATTQCDIHYQSLLEKPFKKIEFRLFSTMASLSLTKYIPKFTKGWVDLWLMHDYFFWSKWQSRVQFNLDQCLSVFTLRRLPLNPIIWQLPVHKLESEDFGRHQASFLALCTSNLSLIFCFLLKQINGHLARCGVSWFLKVLWLESTCQIYSEKVHWL